jgi:hypothetical protein
LLIGTLMVDCVTVGVHPLDNDATTSFYTTAAAPLSQVITFAGDGTVTCTTAPTPTPVPPTATPTPLPALAIVKTPSLANIWICTATVVPAPTAVPPIPPGIKVCPGPKEVGFVNGQNGLIIDEYLINGTGVGLGAFEFQVKFDHKVFDVEVKATTFLGSTGRGTFCTTVFPAQTVTENYINFGCVSFGINPITGLPVAGPTGNGVIAQVNISIDSDIPFRVRPTAMNGIVRVILDENCEAADVLGNPLPGSVQGGLTPQCGDASVTVRRLEGDVNSDCKVDIVDGAILAARYGSFYGSLVYDPFYDLEPKITDFDIDIKDIQFVAGRVPSTCTLPLPLGGQPPVPGLNVGTP